MVRDLSLVKHRLGDIAMTRRDEIVCFMAAYIEQHHNAPSSREIAYHFGISQQTAYGHLMRLQIEGRLIQIDGRWKLQGATWEAPDELIAT